MRLVNMKTRKNRRLSLWLLFVSLTNCTTGGADLRAKYDICFKEDTPGANSRYVTYTPVRCSDKRVVLGEPIGGELASLEFEDTDADGVSEIIVSSEFWCRWGFTPCVGPRRTTVKVSGAPDSPEFTVVRVEIFTPSPEFR